MSPSAALQSLTTRPPTLVTAARGIARAAAIACASLACSACGAARGHTVRNDVRAESSGEEFAESSRGEASDDGRPPTAAEARAMRELVTVAEEIRGLHFVRPVRIRVQNSTAIRASLSREMEDEDLLESRDLYVALGLLPVDVDVRELLLRVLGEQVVGYYDTKRARLVVRDDVLGALVQTRRRDRNAIDEGGMVLVHELVHALQDQVLGLGVSYEAERTIDEGNAFHALVEGDATLAMIGYLAERAGGDLARLTSRPEVLRTALQAGPGPGESSELMSAPLIVRVPLLSAYFDGLLFCASLHAQQAWPGVDRAYQNIPASSEQVLHPDRFARGERPEIVTLPAVPELAAAGTTTLTDDTIGELEMSVYFRLALNEADAQRAADGWGGDRLRVVRDARGVLGAIWQTRWDSEADAVEAEAAARAVMDAAQSGERARSAVVRNGRAVLILRGVAPALHGPVRAALSVFAAAR